MALMLFAATAGFSPIFATSTFAQTPSTIEGDVTIDYLLDSERFVLDASGLVSPSGAGILITGF